MQKLHLVGFTKDHDGLILSARRGTRSGGYVVTIDDALVEAVEEYAARQEEAEAEVEPERPPRVESSLSVREIQARLRQGRSVADVAKAAGVEPDWVERFAPPVLAERAQVVSRVRQAHLERARLGRSELPVGEAVRKSLADRGVALTAEEFDQAWSARQVAEGRWTVRFRFHYRAKDQVLQFDFNDESGAVTPTDKAGQYAFVAPAKRASRPQPAAEPDRPKVKRAVVGSGYRADDDKKATTRSAKEREKANAALQKAAAKRAADATKAAARLAREKAAAAARAERERKAEEARRAREQQAKERARKAAAAEKERTAKAAAARKAAEKKAREEARAKEKAEREAAKKEAAKAAEAAKKAAAKQAAAKKAPTKKAAAKEPAAKKAPSTKAATNKAPARKRPATKASTAKASTSRAPAMKAPATELPVWKASAESAASGKTAPVTAPVARAAAESLPVAPPAEAAPVREAQPASPVDRRPTASPTPPVGRIAPRPSPRPSPSTGDPATDARQAATSEPPSRPVFRRGLVERVSGETAVVRPAGGDAQAAHPNGSEPPRRPDRPRRTRPLRAT